MSKEDKNILGAFLLVRHIEELTIEEIKDVQQAIKRVWNNFDKAIEDLKGTLKINRHYIEKTKYGKNEWICMDIDHIQELIDMLEEVKKDER